MFTIEPLPGQQLVILFHSVIHSTRACSFRATQKKPHCEKTNPKKTPKSVLIRFRVIFSQTNYDVSSVFDANAENPILVRYYN